MALTGLGYLLAYLRDAGVAALFGASRVTDAFFVGTFPSMVLYAVVITGSFVPALLPVFAQGRTPEEGRQILVSAGRWFLLGTLALVAVVEFFAPAVIASLAPGLSGSTLEDATIYLRLSMPMLLFLAPSAVAGAVLNHRHEFVIPALGSLAFGGTMLASVAFAPLWGLWVVALAMVAGALLQLAILMCALPSSYRLAVLSLQRGYDNVSALRLVRLAAPMLLYMSLTQALPLLERLLASSLQGGVLSHMAYATKLYTLPVTVVATSFTTVLFPGLAQQAATANGNIKSIRYSARRGLFQLALLTAPITLVIILCAPLIVSLAFSRGSFNAADAHITAKLLSIYALALVPLSLNILMSRVFYATRETVTPLLAGGAALVSYLGIGSILMPILGAEGLALTMALATSAATVVMLVRLFYGLDVRGTRSGLLKNLTPHPSPLTPNYTKSETTHEI